MNFKKLIPDNLPPVTVTLQAVDNQWVPGRLLRQMLRNRLSLEQVTDQRNRSVRTEFFRSLINAETVVAAHNAYINNAVVGSFMDPRHPEYGALRTLLAQGTIVPFLYSSSSPEIAPGELGFSHNDPQRENWNRLCREVDDLRCLRFDWDDASHETKVQLRLNQAFHMRVSNLSAIDPIVFVKAFGLPEEWAEPLRERLLEVSETCLAHLKSTRKHIRREHIYERHVVADGTKPVHGKYDPAKLFVAELKQLVDLIYAANLALALGRYPLTPVDSPTCSVLQDSLANEGRSNESELTGDGILDLLKVLKFDFIQRDLFLNSYGSLTLDDVVAIRSDVDRPVWRPYIKSVASLLRNRDFVDAEGIASVYRNYAELARHAGELAAARRKREMRAVWEPRVKLVIEVSGITALDVLWHEEGGIAYKVAAHVLLDRLAEGAAPAVARLVVAGRDFLTGDPVTDEVAASIVFWQGRMTHAGEQFAQLARKLAENPRFTEIRTDIPADKITTIDEGG